VATGHAVDLVECALSKIRAKRDVILSVTQYHVAAEDVAHSNLVVTVPREAARDARGVQILPVPLRIPASDVRQFWHRRAHRDPANQ
jgi:DNA-binding transcriptional LysR family regulator